MIFYIREQFDTDYRKDDNPDHFYLLNNNWDDWFEYETVYNAWYMGYNIGGLRIGRKGQTERRAKLDDHFERLPDNYFSLGIDVTYYSNIKKKEIREEVLGGLRDLAYNLDLFNSVEYENVVQVSLLRDTSSKTVRGQFHRIAEGGAVLTDYMFTYTSTDLDLETGKNQKLTFEVDADNNVPYSNIHVLIGNNGTGKTTLISKMLLALLNNNQNQEKYGAITTDWGESFANIVNISFGIYDNPVFEDNNKNVRIEYKQIGLIKIDKNEKGEDMKKVIYNQIPELFFDSFYTNIKSPTKKQLWEKALDILQKDSTFNELHIERWIEKDGERYQKVKEINQIEEGEIDKDYKKRIDKLYYGEIVKEDFKELSSGHKIILLTLASIINYVEEKTLVFLDEPEEHLHPPLISAFIHTLSYILSFRNAVAIIATHSPVIVQEIPKKCVWKIHKIGNYRLFRRPQIETYGENLGEITSEIFGYDVQATGFHALLKSIAEKNDSYEDAYSTFHGELGKEAKSILRAYMYEKKKESEEKKE